MTLGEIIDQLDRFDEDDTIYTEESVESARAVVARETEDGSVPPAAAGLQYFLEINLAKEAVRVWSEWRDGAMPTRADKVAAVVYYAAHDAFLPTD